MSQFRKKPVVIQAQQWLGPETPHPQVREFSDVEAPMGEKGRFYVETLEGPLRVSPGDWIIRGVKGEFYPCKPDIFAATYESVEAADDDQRRISPSPATLSAEAGARVSVGVPTPAMLAAAARALYGEFQRRHDGIVSWDSLAPGVQRSYAQDAEVMLRAAFTAPEAS